MSFSQSMTLIALIGVVAAPAQAGESVYRLDPLYRSECGSCHVAFPPALLDAAGWRRTLDGLTRHFGEDASVDAPTKARLSSVLAQQAGRHASPSEAPKLTTTAWFRREHREGGKAMALPSVRSPANCSACHPGATTGNYEEHAIRLPRS